MMEREQIDSYKGFYVYALNDEMPDDPRSWDNLGTMYCAHPRYQLGDEQIDGDEDLLYKLTPFDPEEEEELKKANDYFNDQYLALPLYLYDHSGITMNTRGFSCPWDSGQVGLIVVSKEKLRSEFGWKRITDARREKILEYLRGEVEVYDYYLRGMVWGFVIEDKNGEEVDSLWGFYGYPDDEYEKEFKTEARAIIDREIIDRAVRAENELIDSYVMAR